MLQTLGNSNGVPEQCTALYGSSHWESGIHDICSDYMYVQSAVQHAGLSIVLGVTKHEWERLRIKFWAVKFDESVAGGSGAFGVSGYVALASEVRGKRGQLERQRDER